MRVTAIPQPKLKWLRDGEEIKADGSKIKTVQKPDGTATLQIDKVSSSDAGEYKIIATNESGSVASSAQVSVCSKPSFVADLEDDKINEGSPIDLKVKIKGFPQPNLQWLKDGREIKPDDDHIKTTQKPDGSISLTIDNATPNDSGKYTVIASNDLGTSSSSAKISVLSTEETKEDERPEFLVKLIDTAVEKGSPVQLNVRVTGTPQPKLKWFHDGRQLSGTDLNYTISQKPDGSATLAIDKAIPTVDGTYRVQATNDLGTASSAAQLTVYVKPTIEQELRDCEVIEGCETIFEVKVVSLPEATLQWYHDNELIRADGYYIKIKTELEGPATLIITKAALSDSGEYRVVATNEFGTASSSALLTVKSKSEKSRREEEKPTFVTELKDTKVNEGEPIELKVKVTAIPQAKLKWLKDENEIDVDNDHITITPKPDGSVVLTIDSATLSDSGKYTVVASNDLGSSSTSAKISVAPAAKRKEEEEEAEKEKPEFLVKLTDKAVENGSPVELKVKVIGVPQPKLQWFHDDQLISEDDADFTLKQKPDGSAVLSIDKASPAVGGTYKVKATNNAGTASSAAQLTVYVKPTIERELEDCEVVEGYEVTFEVKVISIPEVELQWYHDGQLIKADGHYVKVKSELHGPTTLTITKAKLSDSGDYRVVATNEYGTASSSAILSVKSKSQKARREGEKPTFVTELKDTEVNEGSPLELKVINSMAVLTIETVKTNHSKSTLVNHKNSFYQRIQT